MLDLNARYYSRRKLEYFMSDIIQLLPDSVANQIAAGEVVQRPASAVKELLENAIDAGSTSIKLVIKDAGKTLIQVIDNGCGMSETDARMSFERHATSKIKKATDLFAIQTKGFRGEALASIAAIAHVEMKTRQIGEDLGTKIIIEGSKLKTQEPCSCSYGTSFSVKNLFFNIPARRQFLKSDGIEMKHIIDEFQRVVLTHPNIAFELIHNENTVFKLIEGSLKQRIVGVFGDRYNQRLVPIEENTDFLNVHGFIGKPEFAKKTSGEQFFFVNNRYIKSHYLHHAVMNAYRELLPQKMHPMYLIYLEIDPAEIDINIHPTKTEIKFRDEKSIYAILHATIKRGLGVFNITPTLDFEQENSFNITPLQEGQQIKQPKIRVNRDFNPFDIDPKRSGGLASKFNQKPDTSNWQEMYKITEEVSFEDERKAASSLFSSYEEEEGQKAKNQTIFQLQSKFLVTSIKSGLVVIHQERAHQRILFEQNLSALEQGSNAVQQLLFPQTMDLNPADFELIRTHLYELNALGLQLEEFGKGTYKATGIPAQSKMDNPVKLIEDFLDQLKNSVGNLSLGMHEKVAFALARSMSIKTGTTLNDQEKDHLVNELFACQNPNFSANGKSIVSKFSLEEINSKFD